MKVIKIVLVDDHVILRDGIKSSLKDQRNIKIVGEASNGKEGLEIIKNQKPDLVIIDIHMPEMNGLELVEILSSNYPQVKTLLLSMHDEENYILAAVKAGAHGYIVKHNGKQDLINAIKTLTKGEKYFSNSISNILVEKYLRNDQEKAHKPELTEREKDILKLIVDGCSNQEIADKLSISIRTVETHRFNIMKKMKVKNGIELVKLAIMEKLV